MGAGPGTVAGSGGTPCGSLNGGTRTRPPASITHHAQDASMLYSVLVRLATVNGCCTCRSVGSCMTGRRSRDRQVVDWQPNKKWLAYSNISPAAVGCAPTTSSTTAQPTASSTQSAAMSQPVRVSPGGFDVLPLLAAGSHSACCSGHLG